MTACGLVIEDSLMARRQVAPALQSVGYAVVEAFLAATAKKLAPTTAQA